MNRSRKTLALAIAGLCLYLITATAWATREDTAVQLYWAEIDQSEVLYYGSLDNPYYAYLYAADVATDLYYAYYYAPVGSYMESSALTAYYNASEAQTYWYYTYLYGYDYIYTAAYYSYLTMRDIALTQYYVAFGY